MIIESVTRNKRKNYCSMLAYTPEYVYNASRRANTLNLYVVSKIKKSDVLYQFSARIENGEIRAVVADVAMTLYSHDELINAIYRAFPDDWNNVITILETLLYVE